MYKTIENILFLSLAGFGTNKNWIICVAIVFCIIVFRLFYEKHKSEKRLNKSKESERDNIRETGYFSNEDYRFPLIKGFMKKRQLKKWEHDIKNISKLSEKEKDRVCAEKAGIEWE